MTQRDPSRSAAVVAAHRAAEWLRPEQQRICHDPYAGQLIPEKTTVIGAVEMAPDQAMAIFRQFVPGFHEFFLARTRYIDDELEQALARGIGQVVILGAGYDSRAHRIEGLRGNCPVFEVDHEATQTVKRERLSRISQLNANHARYIPADLDKDDQALQELEAQLTDSGFAADIPSFFIWEGVSMYLTPKAVQHTLAMISRLSAPESMLIFDITRPEVILGTDRRPEALAWLAKARENKEPLQFGIGREAAERLLLELGFTAVTCTGAREIKAAYFSRSDDNRESTPILTIVAARKA